MSYVIQIWEQADAQALPATIYEAVLHLKALHKTQPGQNPKFTRLAQRLVQSKFCECMMCSATAEDEELPCAWLEGPPDGITQDAVYNLGINTDVDGARALVVREANALGLNVMDDQAGEVYLANGKVLTMPRPVSSSTEEEKNYDDIPPTRELLQIVFERITPFMVQHGYKARKGSRSFKRLFPNGWHELQVYSGKDSWPSRLEFEINAYSRFYAAADLVLAVSRPGISPENAKIHRTAYLFQRSWMDDASSGFVNRNGNKEYIVHSYSEIDAVVEHILMKLETRVLPILQTCETIKGLDELLNPDPLIEKYRARSVFGIMDGGGDNIIVAYLARNPRLKQLCDELIPYATGRGKGSAERLQRCIEYVRSHTLVLHDHS